MMKIRIGGYLDKRLDRSIERVCLIHTNIDRILNYHENKQWVTLRIQCNKDRAQCSFNGKAIVKIRTIKSDK
jgi:hypothetical protein